jgi:hypothetical protein
MIVDQNFYDTCFSIFYPMASATVYGQRPKFFRAEHSATAEGENWAYGPSLQKYSTKYRKFFHSTCALSTKKAQKVVNGN